jgi:hypothetical protein
VTRQTGVTPATLRAWSIFLGETIQAGIETIERLMNDRKNNS